MTSKNSLRLLTALTVYTCYVSACCTITVSIQVYTVSAVSMYCHVVLEALLLS